MRQLEKNAMIHPDTPDAPWGTVETRFDPIHSAARLRDAATIKREIDAGVDVDVPNGRAVNGDGGNTALWLAAQGPPPSGLEVARLLIAAGAEVNRRCEHGRTALQMAAAWGHLDVVQLLIQHGADPTIRDEEGMTPSEIATRSKRVAEAQLKPVIEYLNALEQ
jgi:ankyrin repeat protein